MVKRARLKRGKKRYIVLWRGESASFPPSESKEKIAGIVRKENKKYFKEKPYSVGTMRRVGVGAWRRV